MSAESAPLRVRKTRQNNGLASDPGSIRNQKGALEKRHQLIERVENFQPHQHKCRHHQIIAKVHAGIETNVSLGLSSIRDRPSTKPGTRRKESAPGDGCVGNTKKKGLRRRGSDAFVANLFLAGGLLFDASFLSDHAP